MERPCVVIQTQPKARCGAGKRSFSLINLDIVCGINLNVAGSNFGSRQIRYLRSRDRCVLDHRIRNLRVMDERIINVDTSRNGNAIYCGGGSEYLEWVICADSGVLSAGCVKRCGNGKPVCRYNK